MSSFTTPLRVEVLDDQRAGRVTARLLEAFEYHVGAEGSGEVIRVPAGYVTDFASVPRLFWRLEPPLGPAGKAAVVHDWLYSSGGMCCGRTVRANGKPRYINYTRAQADGIFREAMGVLKVPAWKRQLMWAAVRVGGGSGWGR